MRWSGPVRRVLATAVVLATAAVAVPPSSPAVGAAASGIPASPRYAAPATVRGFPALLTPDVVAPRLAFTEDTTELRASPLAVEAPPLDQDRDAATDASYNYAGALAYVSLKDDPQGEVYYRATVDGGTDQRVTCDAAVQTHPVVSPDGRFVAYASNETGSFQIWVSQIDAAGDCTTFPRLQVTHSTGDNLWPAWAGPDELVFSSTRTDPLGDIYRMPFAGVASPAPDSAAEALTDGPAAETQPSTVSLVDAGGVGSFLVVVFTTTAYRPDGSLAWLRMPYGADPRPAPVTSMWGASPPQSSEATLLYLSATSVPTVDLAYTTTDVDPYGDVDVVQIDQTRAAWGTVTVLPDTTRPVFDEPGRAESHPALVETPSSIYLMATRHAHSADVADVVAADGSGRRVIAAGTVAAGIGIVPRDESIPAYSPDGLRIAYSRTTGLEASREIVTAAPDGSGVAPLVSARNPGDIDIQPAWSPNRTQIAFVRYPFNANIVEWEPGQIWVATVATGVARRVSLPAPVGYRYWDEHPSWSPDGTRLVIARATERLHPDIAVTATAPATAFTASTVDGTISVTNLGPGVTAPDAVIVHISGPSIVGGAPGMALTSADSRCAPEPTGLACNLGPMDPGARTTIAVRATPPAAGTYHLVGDVPTMPFELATTNNSGMARIDVTNPPPNIAVALALPDPLVAVAPATYAAVTLTVTNTTVTPIPGSVVVDLAADLLDTSLPNGYFKYGLSFVSALPAVCVVTNDYVITASPPLADSHVTIGVRCTLAAPGPNSSATITFSMAANSYTQRMTLRATAAQVTGEISTADNTAIATTIGPPPPPIGAAVPPAFLADPPTASTTPPLQSPRRASTPANVRPVPNGIPADFATQLWVLDVATGQATALTTVSLPCPPTRVCTPTQVPVRGRQPAWSPDGLRIAAEVRGMVYVLTLADADGDGVADTPASVTGASFATGFSSSNVPTANRPILSAATDPAWSPDGTELAVAGQPAGQPDLWGIYALKPDGTGLRLVTNRRGNPETEPAWQPYADLAVTLAFSPPSVSTGATTVLTATVTNAGPARASLVRLRVELPAGMIPGPVPGGCSLSGLVLDCPMGVLAKGAAAAVAIAVRSTTAGSFSASAVVDSPVPDPRPIDNSATASVLVVQPVLRVDPVVVVPGQVSMATGSGFPPGVQVTLTWDVGLNETRLPVTTRPDGTIAPTQIFVFRRDPLGQRNLVATAVVAGSFDPVSTPTLVAPPPQQPPDFVERR